MSTNKKLHPCQAHHIQKIRTVLIKLSSGDQREYVFGSYLI